ncbi:MAG: DinB family protein [Phycisphaeraceae bacterium]|nr:DinB family protein [Phycisphaeraceae bacterium]MCB9848379.1 DinB family protein [Phycisphaeraceae bacterium]
MNLLDRLLQHDAWTTRRLLGIAGSLPQEALDREFDIGRRTLRATLGHIIDNMEVWTDLMNEQPVRQREGDSVPDLTARLDRAAADLAELAHDIERRGAWDERWTDTLDDPPAEKTFGGAIAHVITHSMHHRAQALHMLRRLGVTDLPEGDVLSWENQR